MTTLYLSLTDHDATARAAALRAESDRLYSAGDMDGGSAAFARMLAVATTVQEFCPRCERTHDALWTLTRTLADTCGHFPVFRLNGAEHVLDMSLPTTVDRLPRDARPVDPTTAAGYWHDDNESHVFAGPNIAAALRATIAAANGADR